MIKCHFLPKVVKNASKYVVIVQWPPVTFAPTDLSAKVVTKGRNFSVVTKKLTQETFFYKENGFSCRTIGAGKTVPCMHACFLVQPLKQGTDLVNILLDNQAWWGPSSGRWFLNTTEVSTNTVLSPYVLFI
jgi:hypothetical protein